MFATKSERQPGASRLLHQRRKILAQAIGRSNAASAFSQASGTYHMSAAGQTTWYDFAKTILEKAGAASRDLRWLAAATSGRPLIARRVIPISTAELQRPAYSVLSNSRLFQTFGVALPAWHSQLQRCFVSENIAADLLAD